MQPETKTCQSCKKDFTIEPEDFVFYEKIKVPAPTFCPQCRLVRRLMWRNERGFFRRTCAKCNKSTIAVYPEDSGITVYCRACWWKDDWDAMEYGIDFDPSKPFFVQINELLRSVPLPSLFGLYSTLQNSEFTNMIGYSKDCFFLTMADWDENCSYGSNVYHCNDTFDNLMLDESQLCYETTNCQKCHEAFYCLDCTASFNISFSKNLVGCSNCIGCVNLKNKQYYIFNQPYSKEEYEKLAPQYAPTSRTQIAKTWRQARVLWAQHPQRFMHSRLTDDVSGDYINNSKNTHDAFMAQDTENARFVGMVTPGKTTDVYDHTHYGVNTELVYETLQVGNGASNIRFCWFVITSTRDMEYSIFSIGAQNSFGCVGVKKKEYCILNKQYSKEEYEKLRAEIIQQMNDQPYVDSMGRVYKYGEFFPTDFSPYAYNVGSAQEFFPLDEARAKAQGFAWAPPKKSENVATILAEEIPDGPAQNVLNAIKEIYECAHKGTCTDQCSGALKLTQAELDFYARFSLPLPALCPNCRHYSRVALRNPWHLWHRTCMCTQPHTHHAGQCPNEFETSYAPDGPEIVYCESCYQQEVV